MPDNIFSGFTFDDEEENTDSLFGGFTFGEDVMELESDDGSLELWAGS